MTAKALKVGLQPFEARGPSDFERAFTTMVNQHIGAAVIHEDTMLNANVKAIARLAACTGCRRADSRNSRWPGA